MGNNICCATGGSGNSSGNEASQSPRSRHRRIERQKGNIAILSGTELINSVEVQKLEEDYNSAEETEEVE